MKYFIDKWISQWCINDWFQWCAIILMKDIDLILLLFKKCILTAPTFAIVLTDFIGWNRRMRRVKRIEVLYFLSFFFSLNLLFSFLLARRSTMLKLLLLPSSYSTNQQQKKKKEELFKFSFFFLSIPCVLLTCICQNETILFVTFIFILAKKKGSSKKQYTHTQIEKRKSQHEKYKKYDFHYSFFLVFIFKYPNIQT